MSTTMSYLTLLAPPFLMKGAQLIHQVWREKKYRSDFNQASRLHLGCGANVIAGWTNIDCESGKGVAVHDLSKPLPVADSKIDFIYSEHFIEHISRAEALLLLTECCRTLKPDGIIRISTPDLRKIISEYQLERTTEWHDMKWRPATPCALINEGMRWWGHQFLYDIDELTLLFKEAGFGQITPHAWGESPHSELRSLECRPYHDEIIIEASKSLA